MAQIPGKNMRLSIIFWFENHRERRIYREKWQPSAFSVYSVVDFKEELKETIWWFSNGNI
jgi:hypothetical protein